MTSNTPKNKTQVMANLTGGKGKKGAKGESGGRSAANVTVNASTQNSILLLVLGQKINALLRARDRIVQQLASSPQSPTTLTAIIQDIDAEINLCLMVTHSIDASIPIHFPSAAEITALSNAVRQLGNATATGAATTALIPAVADVIATFPA